jgi:hypothetical protein
MLPFVNGIVTLLHCIYEIVTLLHCIYLMHSLHHTLRDICKYLMIQSYLWQMVRTKAAEEATLDILEGCAGRGRGQALCGNAPPPPPHSSVCLE